MIVEDPVNAKNNTVAKCFNIQDVLLMFKTVFSKLEKAYQSGDELTSCLEEVLREK